MSTDLFPFTWNAIDGMRQLVVRGLLLTNINHSELVVGYITTVSRLRVWLSGLVSVATC